MSTGTLSKLTDFQGTDGPYVALYNWSRAVYEVMGYSTTAYPSYAKHLTIAANGQISDWKLHAATPLSYGTAQNLRRVRLNALWNSLSQHSKMAFVLLWVFIDPTSLNTREGEFRKWSKPRLEVEIDHQGHFRTCHLRKFTMKAGRPRLRIQVCAFYLSTKLTFVEVKKVRLQLERRFRMIATVLMTDFSIVCPTSSK